MNQKLFFHLLWASHSIVGIQVSLFFLEQQESKISCGSECDAWVEITKSFSITYCSHAVALHFFFYQCLHLLFVNTREGQRKSTPAFYVFDWLWKIYTINENWKFDRVNNRYFLLNVSLTHTHFENKTKKNSGSHFAFITFIISQYLTVSYWF